MSEPKTRQTESREASLRRTARSVFRWCLAYTTFITLVWLYFVISQQDGGVLFRRYNLDPQTIGSVLGGILFFWIGWSWGWYWLKRRLLRRMGMTDGELEIVFSTRDSDFRLREILSRYPERRIRILDMIGRRGRAAVMALVGFYILYLQIRKAPGPDSLALGIQGNFFESVAVGWWMVLSYHSKGYLGRVTYGAQARIMDGIPARANCLLIGTLWGLFKFVMIPLGIQLGEVFPPEFYAALFGYIWLSYVLGDTASEVVGSLWGRQRLRVWGVGEVNRKSLEGTAACFLGSLAICFLISSGNDLTWEWYLFGAWISVSNTAVELWSPRGTDDFTMATTNALWCWAFGFLVLG